MAICEMDGACHDERKARRELSVKPSALGVSLHNRTAIQAVWR